MANGCAVTEPSAHWLFHSWPGLGVDWGLLGVLNTFWGLCVCVCVQDWAHLLGHTGLWRKEEGSCSAPPVLCLQKVVASQPTFRGRHTSFRAYESMFLPPAKGKAILLLDWSSGHLIFYNLDENQLNVLKATCFLSGIFKWCGSYFGCSKRVGTS